MICWMSSDDFPLIILFQALDGFLFVIWSTGRTIYISESITPLLGHLQQELLGKNFLELIHPEDMTMVRDRMFPVSFLPNLCFSTDNFPTSYAITQV